MEDGSTGAIFKLLMAAFLVFLNGFFVAAEFAIVKVRGTRIEEIARQGSGLARVARKAVKHLDAYLSATQLGITIASLALGWIGEPAIADLIAPLFHDMGRLSVAASHTVAVAVAFTIITFMHIVFGELAPKSLAILRPEGVTLWVAYPLDLFYRLFFPAIWVLNTFANLTLRLFGLRAAGEHETAHSEEELRMILSASHAGGFIRDSELDIVRNVFEFAHKQAKDIMVPRVDILYLSTERAWEQNREAALRHGFTRYPLCEGEIDQVVGVIHIKDILARPAGGEAGDIRRIMRPILVIPENKPIDQLLREFQRNHTYMALVADEYGGTAGLVSLEDIVEELVGEIEGEFGAEPKKITPTQDGSFLVDSRLTLSDLRRDLGIALPEEADTIGGYVMSALGAIPRPGDQVEAGGCRLTVVQMAGRRIRRVMLTPLPKPEEREGEE
ncbi:MAG: HlyC/CorC family transporter [Armatimonadetes bacterium]|nr:HlyC/CorC family transporter [Armatimonadota bacterium]